MKEIYVRLGIIEADLKGKIKAFTYLLEEEKICLKETISEGLRNDCIYQIDKYETIIKVLKESLESISKYKREIEI